MGPEFYPKMDELLALMKVYMAKLRTGTVTYLDIEKTKEAALLFHACVEEIGSGLG